MSTGNPAHERSVPLRRPVRFSLTRGGTDGNEQLTTLTGALLLVMFAVLGVTILRIGQLLSVHMFVGLLLLGPITLKLGSTGYRFVRYYTGNRAYVEKGPPVPIMRGLAPLVVASTLVVFGSGVLLLVLGPSSRHDVFMVHKASFFVWLGVTGLHVLGHLAEIPRGVRGALTTHNDRRVPGGAGRWLALAGALVAGLVLAVALIPEFGAWTAHGFAFHHHFHGPRSG